MTITISLSSHVEATLRERAAAEGKDVAGVAEELIEQAVASQPSDSVATGQWAARFAAWMATVDRRAANYPPGFRADDSRESIYEGGGE
jgi:hypothetical protein